MAELSIGKSVHGKTLNFRLAGELGIKGSMALKEMIAGSIQQGTRAVVIDLSNISLLSSVGLTALMKIHELCKAKSIKLDIVCPQAPVREIFKFTGTDRLLPIHENEKTLQDVLP